MANPYQADCYYSLKFSEPLLDKHKTTNVIMNHAWSQRFTVARFPFTIKHM